MRRQGITKHIRKRIAYLHPMDFKHRPVSGRKRKHLRAQGFTIVQATDWVQVLNANFDDIYGDYIDLLLPDAASVLDAISWKGPQFDGTIFHL